MRKTITISILLSLSLVACTTNHTKNTPSKGPVKFIDLTSDTSQTLIDDYWVVTKKQEPLYPVDAAKRGVSGCVDLEVGISNEGKMIVYKVKKSYPQGIFDDYAAAALLKWRWKAADANVDKLPVLTLMHMGFKVIGSKNKQQAQEECGKFHV
ncbi:energy transducer TonB [Pseudoalteromonas sp. JBTF-M23]|uniref:Energy transducer TonB n=1 Tax=Pseudoalteromonas caenipelagi TaxID=2726988 RepID=A0A849V9C0_9GAMM|nr:energy transducer TonB [Pseudoalteromonas caenipelagi]NOU49233.1 energy transducer TonB [Pseudoalteromonas caenipelagi]